MSARRIIEGLWDAIGFARGDWSRASRVTVHDPDTGRMVADIRPKPARYYYLALQDGRLDSRRFKTAAAAERARMRLPKDFREGVCVMEAPL